MGKQDDDYLYDRLEEEWEKEGCPCPHCKWKMVRDHEREAQTSVPIPGNIYGTRRPLYTYYKCGNCGYTK